MARPHVDRLTDAAQRFEKGIDPNLDFSDIDKKLIDLISDRTGKNRDVNRLKAVFESAAKPEAGKLYFTEAEWEHAVRSGGHEVDGEAALGVDGGEVQLGPISKQGNGYLRRTLYLGALSSLARAQARPVKADPKLRLVLKEFPVLGPGSVEAAKVAVAVRMQDKTGKKYLEFHQKLLGGRGQADKARALAVAKDIGLDMPRLEKDLANAEVKAALVHNPKTPQVFALRILPGLPEAEIKAAIAARGEAATRTVVLVPDSAHGTNPASCALNGFEAVPFASGSAGVVEMAMREPDALQRQAEMIEGAEQPVDVAARIHHCGNARCFAPDQRAILSERGNGNDGDAHRRNVAESPTPRKPRLLAARNESSRIVAIRRSDNSPRRYSSNTT